MMHDALIATKHVSTAGLVQRKDGKVRGSTPGFKIEDFEIKAISVAFRDVTVARAQPLAVNGAEYDCIRADSNSIYAKSGRTGLIVARTGAHFIIAHFEEGMHASVCVEAVEKLANYFR